MKWYKLIAPAAIGMTVGTIIGKKVKEEWLFPEIALKRAKESFIEHGPISGSWILMEIEDYEINGETLKVYRGGVSRNIDGQTTQYTFYVDAKDGKLLEINQI